jgi:homoaconitase/3-isopropylmalate dehydratase large subunit
MESFTLCPENGITLPGATIVGIHILHTVPLVPCFQIGTSEVNGPFCNVSCNQNLKKCLSTSLVTSIRVYTKDVALIYHLKTIHFRRYWLFCGIRRKSFWWEGRMTVCNLVSRRRNDCSRSNDF